LEGAASPFRPIGPRKLRDDGFHVGDAGDALGVAPGPFEAKRGAPVVDYEQDAVAQRQLVPQRPQILALLGVAVALGTSGGWLVSIAHPDQVTGHEPP